MSTRKAMKTAARLMAGKAARVLYLLGLLQGKVADRADQTDKHQDQPRDRHGRRPQQHRTATQEKESDDEKVERGRRYSRHSAPGQEQCNSKAYLVRVGAG